MFDGPLTAIFDATKLPQFLVLPIYLYRPYIIFQGASFPEHSNILFHSKLNGLPI